MATLYNKLHRVLLLYKGTCKFTLVCQFYNKKFTYLYKNKRFIFYVANSKDTKDTINIFFICFIKNVIHTILKPIAPDQFSAINMLYVKVIMKLRRLSNKKTKEAECPKKFESEQKHHSVSADKGDATVIKNTSYYQSKLRNLIRTHTRFYRTQRRKS